MFNENVINSPTLEIGFHSCERQFPIPYIIINIYKMGQLPHSPRGHFLTGTEPTESIGRVTGRV